MVESTKIIAASAVSDSCGSVRTEIPDTGARRYGSLASDMVRNEVRRRADALGVARVARDLGVSTEAIARTIAGLQQAPGTIDRITAKLLVLAP